MTDLKSVQDQEVKFSVFNMETNRKIYKEFTDQIVRDKACIDELQRILKENGIEVPDDVIKSLAPPKKQVHHEERVMEDGSLYALQSSLEVIRDQYKIHEVSVQFRNLTFWDSVPKKSIPTVGSAVKNLIFGSGPKHRVNIIKDLTGRILPKTMTLLMGPPGCGKSTLLKALAGQLVVGKAHLEGDILYNGDSVSSGKYLVGKVASYTDEKEQHAGTLTVKETMEFAWDLTTGGHHSYGIAQDEKTAEVLNRDDPHKIKMHNMIKTLGLSECANTLVGSASVRGVSGGQKRRVTLGEMLMPPRPLRYMDAISNGLDSATTYDIVQAVKLITQTVGLTTVVSLLQPAPEVFYSFEDVIVMADGQIIYHGPTRSVMQYFSDLGYHCPEIMDVADFLQELPTADGKRFAVGHTTVSGGEPPFGTEALAKAWKESALFHTMRGEMEMSVKECTHKWPAVFREHFPGTFWYSLTHCLERQLKLTMRDKSFLTGRILQTLLVAVIGGSLYNNTATADTNTLSGILYFGGIFGALSSMAMTPVVFAQREVFKKHYRALFYPAPAFVLSQTLILIPLQVVETLLYSIIIYWSVGLTTADNGSRFFTFMVIVFTFNLCVSQFYRMLASCITAPSIAQTMSGIFLILMVLFSSFIIPANSIPNGWIWFYYINPIAYMLRALVVNEYTSADYDHIVCDGSLCQRFGDAVLKSRGNPTEQAWVWYSVAIMYALFFLFLFLNYLALVYVPTDPLPPPPIVVDHSEGAVESKSTKSETPLVEIPFEPVSFAFQNIRYTVKVGKHEKLDLLKGVSGCFQPGTVTALMGSSGAGKTTLLDVLSGRKNTGKIEGDIFINGAPLDKKHFRRTMGYVEQFDTLAPHDTAREAVEFSAALRLPRDTSPDLRAQWVTTVLTLLELMPLENTMVGSAISGGMSFEQKKRVSIAVELAANPAILFLDEPTTGLDSRSAQIIVRSIKRVAASGRSIVCTIHQPSAVIFDAFDSLLLLRRGGQTVYFGELGDNSCHLVSYFEAIPGVAPKKAGVNPASWMLEVIGAGTTTGNTTDFDAYYKQSALCVTNTAQVRVLCPSPADSQDELELLEEGHLELHFNAEGKLTPHHKKHSYNATYWAQFKLLMYRFHLAYWRSPTYNFVRVVVSTIIALIFASTYAQQKYTTDVDVIARVAVVYISVMFMGVVNMKSVQPVILEERPAFYREQFSKLYDVKLYVLAATLVEIPYLLVTSLAFVVPFFFIVGFDRDGTTVKFFWYWLFSATYMSVMVFLGHLLSSSMKDAAAVDVLGGMLGTVISLFGGFLIKPELFPSFWTFMYWLDPLHYVIEGLAVTQFHRDHTMVKITGESTVMTAHSYLHSFYTEWKYSHRGYDVIALCMFIVLLRIATYFSLEYVRHDKR